MTESTIENLRISLGQLSLTAMSLEDFSSMLIAHGLKGGSFDDASLHELQERCIRNLMNSSASGVRIEKEADMFYGAIDHTRKLMAGAINRAKAN